MKSRFELWIAAALVLTISSPLRAESEISVLTQNQYLGADLVPIITAPDLPAFNMAVLGALEEATANDFQVRAGLLAQQIADRQPHLVGLQEAFVFACLDLFPPAPGQGCDDPAISGAFNDQLALTMDALAALGEDYVVSASVQHLNIDIPVDTTMNFIPNILLTATDRDVILARGDIAPTVSAVPYSDTCVRPSADGGPGCNYVVVAEAMTAVGPIAIERGWLGVDATVAGKDYRFVNTHLEVMDVDPMDPLSPFVQAAQAAELIGVLALSTPLDRSLIVVGDINSTPEDPFVPGVFPPPFETGLLPPYMQFIDAGYTDTWTLRPGALPGYTCCQLEDLSNVLSILDERIDMIFSLEIPTKVKRARVVGASIPEKSSVFGLWPSDHGQVAADLQFE